MKEIVDLKDFSGLPVIGGIQVLTLEFLPDAVGPTIKTTKTKLINLIVNKYSNVNLKEVVCHDGKKYFSDTITCWLGDLEIDFVVKIQNSHMIIVKLEVTNE